MDWRRIGLWALIALIAVGVIVTVKTVDSRERRRSTVPAAETSRPAPPSVGSSETPWYRPMARFGLPRTPAAHMYDVGGSDLVPLLRAIPITQGSLQSLGGYQAAARTAADARRLARDVRFPERLLGGHFAWLGIRLSADARNGEMIVLYDNGIELREKWRTSPLGMAAETKRQRLAGGRAQTSADPAPASFAATDGTTLHLDAYGSDELIREVRVGETTGYGADAGVTGGDGVRQPRPGFLHWSQGQVTYTLTGYQRSVAELLDVALSIR